MRTTAGKAAPLIFVVLFVATLAWAYPYGPPNHATGAPGELDCTFCHNSFPLNSGPGILNITMSPSFPAPDDTVEIHIALAQPGQIRWGFEVTAVDAGGGDPPSQFVITDSARTQLSLDANGRTYIKHTLAGTDSGTVDASPGWSFGWVVPRYLTLAVDFYAAGNAANGNNLSSGDYIYTDSLQVRASIDFFFNTGDVDESGSITSADIIYLVGYVFKGGPDPVPCTAVGDVNCDGTITAADVIYLVGYVFKGGPGPCNVLTLFPDTWWCP